MVEYIGIFERGNSMKSTIQLDERRTLALMKVINDGKYININGLFKSLGINMDNFNNQLKKIKVNDPEKYINYLYVNEQNLKQFKSLCKKIRSIHGTNFFTNKWLNNLLKNKIGLYQQKPLTLW